MEGMAHSADDLRPGTPIDRYLIERVVGRGGHAVVYEARHRELGVRVAIKVLKPGHKPSQQIVERFLREGRALAKLKHPNVVTVHDVGEHEGAPYLVMEFLEGQSLRSWLSTGQALPVETALDLMLPVIAAMATAHDAGVLHRDLKPPNIMLERGGDARVRPVVVDFGIASLDEPGQGLTSADTLLGTPNYFSPEHVRGAGSIVAESDQFALGAILYECLTGQRAFPAPWPAVVRDIATGSFRPPRSLRPDLPAALEAVVLRAMALDPASRFPSLRVMGRALLPLASPATASLWKRAFVSDDDLTSELRITPASPAPMRPEPAPEAHDASLEPSAHDIAEATVVVSGPSRLRRAAALAAAVLAVVAVVVASAELGRRQPTGAFSIAVDVVPPEATLIVDGVEVAHGHYAQRYARDGATHTLTVSAAGYEPYDSTFINVAPEPRIALRPVAPTLSASAIAPAAPPASAPTSVAVPSAPAERARDHARPRQRSQRREPATSAPSTSVVPEPTPERGTNDTLIMKESGGSE